MRRRKEASCLWRQHLETNKQTNSLSRGQRSKLLDQIWFLGPRCSAAPPPGDTDQVHQNQSVVNRRSSSVLGRSLKLVNVFWRFWFWPQRLRPDWEIKLPVVYSYCSVVWVWWSGSVPAFQSKQFPLEINKVFWMVPQQVSLPRSVIQTQLDWEQQHLQVDPEPAGEPGLGQRGTKSSAFKPNLKQQRCQNVQNTWFIQNQNHRM